jgi:hypothetical protein
LPKTNNVKNPPRQLYYGRSLGHDITIHCAVALSVTALVIKASASVSAEKIEAFIRISIDRQTDIAPGN